MENLKIVEFEKFCNICKHKRVGEGESPCDECLSVPARPDSKTPEHFEKRR